MYLPTSLVTLVLALTASISASPIRQVDSSSSPSLADTLAKRDYCSNGWYGTRVTCSYRTVPLSIARIAISSACAAVESCTPGSGTYPFGSGTASGFRWSNETSYSPTTYNSTVYNTPTTNGGKANQTQVEVTALVKVGEQCIDGLSSLDAKTCESDFEGLISAQCGGAGLSKDQFASKFNSLPNVLR